MKRKFTASVWREDAWYIAQCLEVDVASQANAESEALANLHEALELHVSEPLAAAVPEVHAIEVELGIA